MAQNKSYKELMELQGQSGGQQGTQAQTSNQMLDLILNRKPFQYNAQTDPGAQAARKTAALNAKAVTRDTLGQHAAMTGGMPSTAAVSAAAQAGSAAMQQGADRVAELEQLAFQNYQTEGQNMYNAYAALQQQEGDAFNRQMQEQQWAYQKEQDAYQREQDEYNKKVAEAQLRAMYGDTSGLKALGIDLSNYNASGGGYSGGGGGSYRGSGGGGSGSGGGGNDSGGGIPASVSDSWWIDYGGELPEDVWAAAAAKYGEAELIAEGFKKAKKSNPKPGGGGNSSGSSGSGGGHGKNPTPGRGFGTIAMG